MTRYEKGILEGATRVKCNCVDDGAKAAMNDARQNSRETGGISFES